MADTYRAVIPYESLDPLTIGAADDESKVYRDQLELEIPTRNLVAAIYPDEPAHLPDATDAARRALESPVSGPTLLRAARRRQERRRDHRQPVPADARVEAPAGRARRARGGGHGRTPASSARTARSSRCPSRTSSRRSAARTSRAWSGSGSRSSRTTRATPRCTVHRRLRRAARPCGCTRRSRARDVKITIGQAQANHWGAGGGGKLILPGVVSDETIESNHCNFVPSPQTHYGALAGPMRSDIDDVATMCGLDVHAERRARHARARHRSSTSASTRPRTARRSSASTRSTRTSRSCPSTGRPTSRSAASSPRPTTCSSTPAGAACRPTSS